MGNKDKIFAYGTLTDHKVQRQIFGRIITGSRDTLKGYKRSKIKIDGEIYPLICLDTKRRVNGFVIEVTKSELEKIDEYETDIYKREQVVLRSGISAWVYVRR